MGGAGCIGADSEDMSFVAVLNVAITGYGVAALRSLNAAFIGGSGVTGSAGNGVGLLLQTGGIGEFAGTSVTGTSGDVQIDGRVGVTWAIAGTWTQSNAGLPGTQISFSGSFLAQIAGTTTAYYGQGGIPATALSSVTALRWPMSPGRLIQNLRGTILANPATTTTTYTLMRSPVATGVPAATAIVVTVTGGTIGSVADLTHTVQYQDGDQADLQSTNLNGTAVVVVSSWSMQAV